MDCKITRQNVSTEKLVFNKNVEQAIDTSFTLPEYCPDIGRILKCRITAKPASKSVNGAMLTVDGVATVCILYTQADNGCLRSFEYPVPFSKQTELAESLDGAKWTASVRIKTDYCNCKLQNERTVDVHAALVLSISLKAAIITDVITDIDEPSVQQERGAAPATSPVDTVEKFLMLSDRLDLPESAPLIRNILRSDVRCVVDDSRIIGTRVMVKGNVLIDILYVTEPDMKTGNAKFSLPFSQTVEMDNLTESCSVSTLSDVVSSEIRAHTGMSGEIRTVSAEVKISLCVSAYCNLEVPLVYDAFSTDKEMSIQTDRVTFEKVVKSVNENYSCKKMLDIPPDSIASVIDIWCDTYLSSARCENGALVLTGVATVNVLACDKGGDMSDYERNIDFEYRTPLETVPEQYRIDAEVVVESCAYALSNDGLEIRVELNVRADLIAISSKQIIIGAALGNPKTAKDNSAIVVCFAKRGDSVWDIAKKYNTSPEDIMQINELTEKTLPDDKMLIISCC